MNTVVDVLIFRGVSQDYTYLVPQTLAEHLSVGTHVRIPLGRGTAEGIVTCISEIESDIAALKPILGVLDKKPTLPAALMDLMVWMRRTYRLTGMKAYQSVLGATISDTKSDSVSSTADTQPATLPPLTSDQAEAIETISAPYGPAEFLIEGVTGSGKTRCYLELVGRCISKGQSAIILIPEIALTPQTAGHFQSAFPGKVTVMHSGLTPKQKKQAWRQAYDGKTPIVVGPRSAIFSPFSDLGLIIIDEEHDGSYKQEQTPRYWVHDIARFRSVYHQAKLIYGSATPCLETAAAARLEKRIGYAVLPRRFNNSPLPNVSLIDMRTEYAEGRKDLICQALQDALAERLQKKEKSIVLVNRRGFAPHISCQNCGKTYCCPGCALSYTYHTDHVFRCHRCFRSQPVTHTCPSCKKPGLAFGGTGIQKVELALRSRFPNANLLRMDRDTTHTARQLEDTLTRFRNEGDILLGTQLIAKGHDIPQVTLVGVIGIDTVLNLPDFRSAERTFQLITQVAGRAGRGDKKGHVWVQTSQPDHYAIQAASSHDFNRFFGEEIQFRQALDYPPFSRLLNLIISGKKRDAVQSFAATLFDTTRKQLPDSVGMLGPAPLPVEKIQDHFRWHILFKLPADLPLHTVVSVVPEALPSGVRLILDPDPRSLM